MTNRPDPLRQTRTNIVDVRNRVLSTVRLFYKQCPKSILILLLTLATNAVCQAQSGATNPRQYRAHRWAVEDGLLYNNLNTMIKDAQGFLWIGNPFGGLSRFDGSTFKTFLPDRHDPKALNNNNVIGFAEDSLHNIWIGTNSGVARYDLVTGTFTHVNAVGDTTLKDRSISPFWATKHLLYCFESSNNVVTIDIRSLQKKTLLKLPLTDSLQLFWNEDSNTVLDTTSNSLWVQLFAGVSRDTINLVQISIPDGKRTLYHMPCLRKGITHRHGPLAMRYDRARNSIWINSGDGLMEFTLKDKKFHPVSVFNELITEPEYDGGFGLDMDTKGSIWLAIRTAGILVYDPQRNEVFKPFGKNQKLQQEVGEGLVQLYCDRDGMAWTSSFVEKGVHQIVPYDPPVLQYHARPDVRDSLSDPRIIAIFPGPGGTVWIGTATGLNIFDPQTGIFEVLTEKDLPGLTDRAISPLYIDTVRQKAWLGTSKNLEDHFEMEVYEMDLVTRRCRQVIFRNKGQLVEKIHASELKPFEDGLLISDDINGLFKVSMDKPEADLIVPFKKVTLTGRYEVKDNQFIFVSNWRFSYAANELNITAEKRNGQWIQVPHVLDSIYWTNIWPDKTDKTYWLGIGHELVHYSNTFDKIKTYGETDGYRGRLHFMLQDNYGNNWFGNSSGQIGRFNPTTDFIAILSDSEGYQNQTFDYYTASAIDAHGDIYLGAFTYGYNTHNALTRIIPSKYVSVTNSQVYLKSLMINHKRFSLPVEVNSLQNLSLKHNENTIAIDAGIIDFYSAGKGKIRYKLVRDNGEGDWVYQGSNAAIRLDGLPSDSYRLTMQASNASGEYTGPEKVLMITITPPFWLTWWFGTLSAIAIFTGLYFIVQLRSRNLRRVNAQLEEKVVLRTNDLSRSLDDLRSAQRQLVQSEKMASLGELTAGIAHEIQNPLNFVNNFSDVSSELLDEMNEQLETGNIDGAKEISADVKENLKKIMHHGGRADAIVKSMLQHSRSSSGAKETVSINKIADEYLRLAYHGLRAKDKSFNASMETDFDESVGNVSIIPQDIGRVILNLVTNAFYAVTEKAKTVEGGYAPTVWVSSKRMNDKVAVHVRDNGNGIPAEIFEKIFQPFFTTKPTGEGTGLGLSLSYDIVQVHGGKMTVETKPGQGSEFTILLPLK